jgi:serine/threonine-protein kinase RsbW
LNKRLVLSATLENLAPFTAHVREAALDCGLDDKAVNQVELALEEILVNVISYAYPEGSKGDAEVSCSWEKDRSLTIVVADWGAPFNPLDRPDPDIGLALEDRGIGGLGILLTKKMIDRIDYERRQGKNVVTLVKKKRD